MIKKEEAEYLKNEKVKSGKEWEQAMDEIRMLNESQKDFKVFDKRIKKLEKELEKKDKLIEKLRNKQIKIDFSMEDKPTKKLKEIERANGGQANIKDLNRILSLVNGEGRVKLSDLTKTCILKEKKCKEALNFLLKNKLLDQEKSRSALFIVKCKEVNKWC